MLPKHPIADGLLRIPARWKARPNKFGITIPLGRCLLNAEEMLSCVSLSPHVAAFARSDRFGFPAVGLALLLSLCVVSPPRVAFGETPVVPPPVESITSASSTEAALARAIATAELAKQRRDAILDLESRRHATAIERMRAEHVVRTAEAEVEALRSLDRLAKRMDVSENDSLRTVPGSRFAVLPSASLPGQAIDETVSIDGETSGRSTQAAMLGLLRREAADETAAAWWAFEADRVEAYREAVLSLHADRHATDAERDEVLFISERLAAAQAADQSRRRELATLAGVEAESESLTPPADPLALVEAAGANAGAALIVAAERWVAAQLSLAIAESERTLQVERQAGIAALPAAARSPRELEAATRDRDQAIAAVARAQADHDLAASWVGWLATADAASIPEESLVAFTPWQSAETTAPAESAAALLDHETNTNEPALSFAPRRRVRALSLTEVAQPRAYAFTAGSPYDPFPEVMQPTDRLAPLPGVNLGSLAAPGSNRLFQPGATYSSGYAFGQIRYDLPRELRYPRADGYGGPWSLPGSPTDRLRLRRRTPLHWGW